MITIYGIKTCDSCQKALKYFSVKATFVDIRSNPLSTEKLELFLTLFGNQLINTRSKTWQSLNSEEQAKKSIELLEEFPLLIKRPIIECSDTLTTTIGWNEKIRNEYN